MTYLKNIISRSTSCGINSDCIRDRSKAERYVLEENEQYSSNKKSLVATKVCYLFQSYYKPIYVTVEELAGTRWFTLYKQCHCFRRLAKRCEFMKIYIWLCYLSKINVTICALRNYIILIKQTSFLFFPDTTYITHISN